MLPYPTMYWVELQTEDGRWAAAENGWGASYRYPRRAAAEAAMAGLLRGLGLPPGRGRVTVVEGDDMDAGLAAAQLEVAGHARGCERCRAGNSWTCPRGRALEERCRAISRMIDGLVP